jgi:multidrug efflux pump subunit AcrA (membrane-fusion protein)
MRYRLARWLVSGVTGLLLLPQLTHGAEPVLLARLEHAVLRPVEDLVLSTEDSGVIEETLVQPGQQVAAGQLLLRLRDREQSLLVDRANLELQLSARAVENQIPVTLAEKSCVVAKLELQRAVDSDRTFPGSVSASEIDRLRFALEKAELELLNAQEQLAVKRLELAVKQNDLAQAQQRLQRRLLLAPGDGVITRIDRRAGEWATAGEPCLRIINQSVLRAEGSGNVSNISRLVGRKAEWRGKGSSEPLLFGVVTYIDPEVNSVNGHSRIWAEFRTPAPGMRPGQAGELLIWDEPADAAHSVVPVASGSAPPAP